MSIFAIVNNTIRKICEFVGGASLIIIVLVTIADVVTRYVFKLTNGDIGFTIKGTVEIVSYMMLFALLAAFAAYVEKSQVVVDVFTQGMSKKIRGYFMGAFMMGYFALGLIFVWGLYKSGVDATEHGLVTQDLRLSMTPIFMFSAFLSLLLAYRSLYESINIFGTGEFYDAEETGA